MAKWEADVRERLRTAVRQVSKPMSSLVARDANEGDTRLVITDFLSDALGYNKLEDLLTEFRVKNEYADFGIRIDGDIIAFVECKRATTKLGPKHLRQVEMYAVNEGAEWLILTNGSVWQVYHVSGGLPVTVDAVLEVDLLGSDSPAHKVDGLFYITRESMKRGLISELWKAKAATSPKSIARALRTEPVIAAVRKEIRRQTGHNADQAELLRLLEGTVIRPECLG
jgi:hypothetical protein